MGLGTDGPALPWGKRLNEEDDENNDSKLHSTASHPPPPWQSYTSNANNDWPEPSHPEQRRLQIQWIISDGSDNNNQTHDVCGFLFSQGLLWKLALELLILYFLFGSRHVSDVDPHSDLLASLIATGCVIVRFACTWQHTEQCRYR